jgi:spermidine synthase
LKRFVIRPTDKHKSWLTPLFAATLFTSAALIFWVEPMVAKMLLPLLGGTPAVWNTCLLFFQTLLLAGYTYALFASRRLTFAQQAVAQLVLLVATAFVLPVTISAAAVRTVPREGDPSLWLLGCLLATVGLPFFTLSTLSPLLQNWFAASGHASARDPYFLYSASNAGSLVALAGYPLALEPLLPLLQQSRLWSLVFRAVLVSLVAACALVIWRAQKRDAPARARAEDDDDDGRDPPRDARARVGKDSGEIGEDRGEIDGLLDAPGDGRARGDALASDDAARQSAGRPAAAARLTNARRLRWVLLAFAPSSLMLGVTTYLSTDIASMPLLWAVPLSLYLLTLIVVFARRRAVPRKIVEQLLPGVAIIFTLAYLSGATQPAWFLAALHLLFFTVAALMCHGRLADDRPEARHLSEFYLWMSVGGALGGLFNAIVAPLAFERVLEYPLAVVLACALLPDSRKRTRAAAHATDPAGKIDADTTSKTAETDAASKTVAADSTGRTDGGTTSNTAAAGPAVKIDGDTPTSKTDGDASETKTDDGSTGKTVDDGTPGNVAAAPSGDAAAAPTARERWLDVAAPACVALLTMLLGVFALRLGWETMESLALVVGLPLVAVLQLRRRALRFALALGGVMLGGHFYHSLLTRTVHTERNFFGVLRVVREEEHELNWFYHGTTIHGRQSTALGRRCEPLSYYHREGPLAQVFAAYNARPAAPSVAIVGLGTGATVAYARPGQRWTFYEINPAVLSLASAPDYFTYLSYCTGGATVETVLGDARLRLADAAPASFGLVVLDAFSSDAIPVHLMTQEALDLYLSKLAPGGVVVFHISNRSLDLHPVVADLARSRGLACLAFDDTTRGADKEPSQWAALARRPEELQLLASDPRWRALPSDPARRVWTDDYSNIISIFKWR